MATANLMKMALHKLFQMDKSSVKKYFILKKGYRNLLNY